MERAWPRGMSGRRGIGHVDDLQGLWYLSNTGELWEVTADVGRGKERLGSVGELRWARRYTRQAESHGILW
jgi:hypothetical protein